MPREANDKEGKDRRDQHGAGHRYTIGRGEPRRGAEADDRDDNHEKKDPIGATNVDLTDLS